MWTGARVTEGSLGLVTGGVGAEPEGRGGRGRRAGVEVGETER